MSELFTLPLRIDPDVPDMIIDADGTHIADVSRGLGRPWATAEHEAAMLKRADAYAAFIVRACNAHDSLVAALQAVWDSGHLFGEYHLQMDTVDLMRAALAKARGAAS